MAKLTIVLAIALTVHVAFVSAHTTIITTTIDDENPISEHQECRQQLREHELYQCRTYLQQGQTQTPWELDNKHKEKKKHQEEGLQQCCQELKNVDKQCQCEAVKQVFRDVQTQQQQQGGEYHSQEMEQLKHRAQNLSNKCKLETKRCNRYHHDHYHYRH
ncbi:hypothetical protein M8C21_024722 [Ambrosia artemisiifolia]|uniref:Bifunctional inhibitor/plant lipid transfer protein/seed storage helical domain-containing protein n=1 Tax=Ambrosia artemisiifolia TaxID=4212 RepID=A0AAD5GW71_AMBAR|nr:hypothetical protein M8C21_024722 [Ambrosia artemisiifolia]